MRRRELIAGVGAAATWPIMARGQQRNTRIRRIGVLNGFDNVISNDVRVRPFKAQP
jgi:hypothetical protein